MKPVELGCPGHFILSDRCRWRRHTQVGRYRVSTVGDLYVQDPWVKRDTIGAGPHFFETMVFKTRNRSERQNEGCGCKDIESFDCLDSQRYMTAGEAQRGHERYVSKYLRKQRRRA